MFRFGKFVLIFSVLCSVALFVCACGLDTYYVMDTKPQAGDTPDHSNDDPALRYFEFYAATNSNSGNSDFRFLGTEVYYRIYTDVNTMNSNINSIESVNNSTDYSAAAERMIKTYKFQELCTDEKGSITPLVPAGQEGYYVRIRLTNNFESTAVEESWWSNVARIEIKQTKSSATVAASYTPRRAMGQRYSFDFGRIGKPAYSSTNLIYDEPSSGDEDFSGGTVTDNKYYVVMYAVASGRDTLFRKYYSNVTYLGSITIAANNENN